MGSYASKLLGRYSDEVVEPKVKAPRPENSVPSTPVDAKKTLCIDPRSASVGIPRTPIEVTHTPPNTSRRLATAIPPYLQKKPYLETDLDNIGALAPRKGSPLMISGDGIPATVIQNYGQKKLSQSEIPKIEIGENSPLPFVEHEAGDTPQEILRWKILGIDPRSPAVDFERTPILAPKSIRRLKARSYENLVRRDSCFELGVADQQRLSYCETTAADNVPEVLALPDIVSNLIKAKVNLSESQDLNITENSDCFDSCSSSSGSSVETISCSGEEITVIRNPNVRTEQDAFTSDTTSSSGSSIEKVEDSQDIRYSIDKINRVLSIATRAANKKESVSDVDKKITVWRDSISPEAPENSDTDVSEESASAPGNVIASLPKEEVMIEFDDAEIVNKTLKNQPNKKEETSEESKGKKLEFVDRKIKNNEPADGKIFFQDKIFAPEGKIVNQAPKVRTPLGNRSNNHSKVKSMPMKSPQQILRGKAMSAKLHQENTPPRTIKSKLNSAQWDPDSTVLI